MGSRARQARRGQLNLAGLLGLITTIAVAILVSGLGYRRFGAAGGVIGAIVGVVVGYLSGSLVLASVQWVSDRLFARSMKSSWPVGEAIIVGGLYATPSEKAGSGFRILKVLAVENAVVHVRMYANTFAAIPERIDADSLDLGRITAEAIGSMSLGPLGVGHMPFSMALFFRGNPRLVQKEQVTEDELDGVREWKAAGGGVFG